MDTSPEPPVARLPLIASLVPDRRDRSSAAVQAPAVRTILVLKLDHIGDLLIGAPALMLLRRSFPDAHITLACGPWNVGLARRLGVADTIVAASIYSQNSLADLDAVARMARQDAAFAELDAKGLGPFDLAIDLRRDDDTRELLKMFDARLYAGFGDLETFNYLDVALPFTRHGLHDGASYVKLGPQDLDGGMGHTIDADGLHLTARQGRIELQLSTDTVWPPTDEGIADTRMLGAALHRIDVRGAGGLRELARERMSFGPGWLDWEPWGRWSSLADAVLTLSFPTTTAEVDLLVRVQGHTAHPHPRATVRVSTRDGEAQYTFQTGEEPVSLALACRADISAPTASSERILLRPGRYRGVLRVKLDDPQDWTPLTLSVRGAKLPTRVCKLKTPDAVAEGGVLEFPFEFEHRDAAEPVIVEIEAEPSERGGRLGVLGVELQCLQARSPRLPVTHMETQLLDLAAMVALRFAPELVGPGEEVARRLSEPVAGSSAAEAVAKLRARRGGRRILGLKTPDRRLIGVAIGANKETKRWPDDYFFDLCRRLLRRGVHLALFGGPKEAEDVRALTARLDAPDKVLDLCGCCRIEDLGEALAELDGFIGLDTGTTHFAGRVGVKTLALFGVSHDPKEWGPVGAKSAWAAVEAPCAGCSKSELSECDFGLRCMLMLTPEAVWPLVERQFL